MTGCPSECSTTVRSRSIDFGRGSSSDAGSRAIRVVEFHPPFPEPGITRGIRRIVAASRPDVIHANGWIAYSCAAALVGTRIPLILSVRDYGYSCAVRNLMHDQRRVCTGPGLAKCLACAGGHYGRAKGVAAVAGVFLGRPLLARRVRAIHSVSGFVESIVLRDLIGSPERKWRPHLVQIPDIAPQPTAGPPVGTVSSASGDDPLPPGPFILFVGQLQRQKGLHVLLEAYERLENRPPLVLIGTVWPDTPSQFPPGITVIREAPHATVLAAWERCLFGVAPSIWPDPLPGVVREAMSRARPVVGSAIGGIADMIDDGATGLLVPPGDVDSLRDAMARLIADPELRERMGAAAQSAVAEFTSDAVAAQFEALYERVVAVR